MKFKAMPPANRQSHKANMIYCVYCNRNNFTKLFIKNGFSIVECSGCGLRFVFNPPTQKNVDGIYSESYFTGEVSRFGYTDYVSEAEYGKKNFAKIANNIKRYYQNGKILDVGCASGVLLSLFGNEWQKVGVDVSSYICDYAKEIEGCRVLQGDFASLDFGSESFDVVTFLDTLDHTVNPIANLKKAVGILKKNGLCVVTCGDTDSLFAKFMGKNWYIYIPPTHLFFFSRKVLEKIMNSLGLRIAKIEYAGKWVFLKCCFFRLSYIFPWRPLRRLTLVLMNSFFGKLGIYFNFKDVMTIYAKKI